MPESKKYWYIQLNVNFFEDERIDWLCEQKNGYAYVVLYLKLCLKTANNNGILTRQIGDMIIPYNVDKIAEITHMDVDVVRVALELYKRIGLVYESDENCNFMRLPEVPSMVGYTTQYAIDKAKQRERKKQKELPPVQDYVQDNVQDKVQQELRVKSLELRDNSKDKEEEKDNSRKRPTRAFVPPTVEEVQAYCYEIGASIDPSAFVDYYAAQGWVYGKAGKQMKDWKAAVRNWNRREKQNGGNNGNRTGIDQRSNGNDCPQNQPTKRLKNAFDYLDEIRAGANDSRPVEQGAGDIDWDDLFGMP